MRSRSPVLLAIVLLVVTPAFAWEVRLDGNDGCVSVRALRVDPVGNVLALGYERIDCHGDRGPSFVAKISGKTGQVVWRRELPDFLFAGVLLLDSSGNPFIGQYERHDEDESSFASPPRVARLSGQTGALVWTREGVAPWATTSTGNVLATDESRLVELATADGAERGSMPFPSGARLLGTHPRGDAIAEQSIPDDPSTPKHDAYTRLTRLSRPAGAVEWTKAVRAPTGPGSHIHRVIVDAVGNVVVAGTEQAAASAPHRWFAGLLGGRSGDGRWTTILDWSGQSPGPAGDVHAVSVDAAGDVLLAGNVGFAETSADFAIAKLSRIDGQALWQWSDSDGTDGWDSATAMVSDAGGDVIAVGTSGRPLASRAPVVKLSGADGAIVWRRDTVFRNWLQWDTALLVETDGHGDVVVAGEVGQVSVAIAKLSGPTGGDFPCGNGIHDDAETCDDGNLLPNDGCEADCTASAACDDLDPCSDDALESSGCVFRAIPGIAGQRCVLEHHYPPAVCEHMPRRARKPVEQARKLVTRSPAPGVEVDRRVQRSLERATKRIGHARVSQACRDAVLALLADAASRNPVQ